MVYLQPANEFGTTRLAASWCKLDALACIANRLGGSAGEVDALYLPRPEQRDDAERKPGSGKGAGETARRRVSQQSEQGSDDARHRGV